jgi:Predicted dehydrogenases and related proteins
MLTIGYIGNGKSTNRYHLPFSRNRENIRVKTIFSKYPETDAWEKFADINYTSEIDDILNDDELQLVVVCTQIDSHFEYAKLLLEHGKNALIEKPFVATKAEAELLFKLAKEKGLILQCYQNRRYDSDFLTTQKVIESGKLGDILEVEMSFDYFRPENSLNSTSFVPMNSFLYGHGCHTLDQVISYFGAPQKIHYDVRQILGSGRSNDYFDLDLYYEHPLKVSVKSSYFRLIERPSFVVFGKKGSFVKAGKDRQEEHLKLFYMPGQPGFGEDLPEHYGTLTYVDDNGVFHEEKVPTVTGDYARVYDGLYETIINGKPKTVSDEETILQIEILEQGIKECR